jgi:hypothetical protein
VTDTYRLPPLAEVDPIGARASAAPEERFWTSRSTLAAVRTVARERLVSPWAALGAVLGHVCTRIGPHVVLPPIVGGYASLNTFWALVGASGGGKDAALAVAQEVLHLQDRVPTHEVGTGQGIDSSFTVTAKDGPVQFCDSALFTVTEIDTLAGHASMSGSTVMATLRKVYSGSALGARYADKDKRRPVRAHGYRAALIGGVQPARSGVLLNDKDGGTPQRWLWLPTNDPDARKHAAGIPAPPDAPREALWQQYEYLMATGELSDKDVKDGQKIRPKQRVEIKVCDTARDAVIENRLARLEAPLAAAADDLSGHALLTRLKVAALLALFNGGRIEVTEEDWELSDVIMTVSNATRDACSASLAESARRANVARAVQDIERTDIAAEHAEKRVAAALGRALRRREGWVARADLRRTLPGRDREFFESAIERLTAAGQVEVEAVQTDSMGREIDGCRYRVAVGRPE